MTDARGVVEKVGFSGMTPGEASLRGRIGAYALHATHDSRETTAKARATFLAKFIDQVDPEHTLPEAERLRRAEYARKAHFARLALKSARARSGKKGAPASKREMPPVGPATSGGDGEAL